MILNLSKFNSTTNSDSTLPTFEDIIDQVKIEIQNKIILITFDNNSIKTQSAT